MNKIILGLAIATTTLAFCNSNKSTESQNLRNRTQTISQTDNANLATSKVIEAKNSVSIKEIVSAYLQMKNEVQHKT